MSEYKASEPHFIFEFGDFRLDARRRLLYSRHGGDELQVKPKLVEALLYFVEHQGQLLRKDELLADLWPRQVVEEQNLTQLISSLRHVLGEAPRENRYLSTVPGRGYRFVADVVQIPGQVVPATQPIEPPQSADDSPAGTGRRRLIGFVLAAIAVAATWLAWDLYPERASTPELPTAANGTDAPVIGLPATTIAVLPFENLSADDENGYVAFGLTESILHRLADVSGLRVIARTSVYSTKLRGLDAREAGRVLHARYLVEGSVQRAGERMRATAQLIDAASGTHVWSLRFERTIDDIFEVEDEIARAVADALQVSLREPDHPHARFGTQAYLAFLKGRALNASGKLADAELAVDRFRQAIKTSPDFAAAYVGLADAYRHIGYLKAYGPGRSPIGNPRMERKVMSEGGDKVGPLLAKALALDETLGEAYVLRADLKVLARDHAGAEADYLRGLALSPNYGTGHEHYAEFLMRQGRREDARAAYDTAILVDPLSPRNYYGRGNLYLFSEETGVFSEQAESDYLRALDLDPQYYPAMVRVAAIRWHQGRFAEAVLLAERALAIDPRAEWIRWFLAEFYLEVGERDAARSVLADSPHIYWLSVCLYDGKPQAGVDALQDQGARGFADHDLEAYVLRDAAIVSGDLAQGRKELLSRGEDAFVLVTVAHLALVMGDYDDTQRYAQAVLDDKADRLAYPRAAALTLLGRNDEALALLEDSYERGFRKRWWYAFDRDPAFDVLRSDARFQALAKSAHTHADAERERLAILRERGDVPERRPMPKPGPAAC